MNERDNLRVSLSFLILKLIQASLGLFIPNSITFFVFCLVKYTLVFKFCFLSYLSQIFVLFQILWISVLLTCLKAIYIMLSRMKCIQFG